MTSSDDRPIIGYLDVFAFLAAACPTFAGSPQASKADPNDGEFLRVGHLVAHLIQLLEAEDSDCFLAVFGVVEWVLTRGDDEVLRDPAPMARTRPWPMSGR